MKALLLAGAVLATVACSSEPAAVVAHEHKLSGEGVDAGFAPGTQSPTASPGPSTSEPVTTTTAAPGPEPTTTTTEAPEVTTTTRRTTSTVYEPPSPQGRTTGSGAEPPAGDMPAVMNRIAGCESGSGPNSPGSYTAQNPRSSASGRYQFLDSTWQGLDAAEGYSRAVYAPPAVQDAAARELYSQAGTTPWNASRSCWA